KKTKFDIWGEYDAIINTVRPEGTTSSQAIVEVQRYHRVASFGSTRKPSAVVEDVQPQFSESCCLSETEVEFYCNFGAM
ncbi:unnamed protein product, partial [Euphydryas editha]